MKRMALLIMVVVAGITGVSPALAQEENIVAAVPKSPVTADGNVAGKPTDINVIFNTPLDPEVPGRALLKGKTIKVTFPDAFKRNPDVQINSKNQGLLVLGWPQADVKSDYSVGLEGDHTEVYTANEDILPSGPSSPGIKALHVRGKGFINPPAGDYEIKVVAETGENGAVETGAGKLTILPAIKPSINITNLLFDSPSNNNFQRVQANSALPIPLDFLLFREDGTRDNGVGIAPADLGRFPKYAGGLIVRDKNGDGVLDPAVDDVIGGVIPSAPQGATGQRAFAPTDPTTGRPILSGALKNTKGEAVPGIMRALFHAGSAPGKYEPTFELTGGNAVKMTEIALSAAPSALPATGEPLSWPWEAIVMLATASASAGLLLRRLASSR